MLQVISKKVAFWRCVRILFISLSAFFNLPGIAFADDFVNVLCQTKDISKNGVPVYEEPAGKVVTQVNTDRVVRTYSGQEKTIDGKVWIEISESFKGEWLNLGWASKSDFQCFDTSLLKREKVSVKQLRSVGIALQESMHNLNPIKCDIVPNGWGITMSKLLYAKYKKRGFQYDAMCLAFGSEVFFDPETGKGLPLYEVKDDLFGPRVLWLPDCFKSAKVTGKGGYLIGWRPTGCQIKFHPKTGLPVTNIEEVELSAGGEAGGSVDEDNKSSSISDERLLQLVNGE